MPTDVLIFVAFTVIAFGAFAGVLAYVETSTRATRRKNHPIPGE